MLAQMQRYIIATLDPVEEIGRRYRYDLVGYCEEVLGIPLWRGANGHPGQREIAYHLADCRIKLEARVRWEEGRFRDDVELIVWQEERRAELVEREHFDPAYCDAHWLPGDVIRNVVVIMGGHKLGKSVLMAFLLLWLLCTTDALSGAVYAPKVDKAKRTVWRYVDFALAGTWATAGQDLSPLAALRTARGAAPRLHLDYARGVETQATRVSGGQGSSIVQGEHGATGCHIFEEAEGITHPEIYDGVRSMVGSGVQFWVWTLNPASSTSTAQQFMDSPDVRRYSLSCLDHPNVADGRVSVPGAITRSAIDALLVGKAAWAERVSGHDAKRATFELPWRPGEIYRPLGPWWWRVLGAPPPMASYDSVVSGIVYRLAEERGEDWAAVFDASPAAVGQLGVDVARSEDGEGDLGAVARKWRGCVELTDEIAERSTDPYVAAVEARLTEMADGGCREVDVVVDNGGGFGGGVVDRARHLPVCRRFARCDWHLVDYAGAPTDRMAYADWITEAYVSVAEALEVVALVDPPARLEEDLCSRKVTWVDVSLGDAKPSVRKLERKVDFRKRLGRSPDRGDAVAMACAPMTGRQADGGFELVDGGRRWSPASSARRSARTS